MDAPLLGEHLLTVAQLVLGAPGVLTLGHESTLHLGERRNTVRRASRHASIEDGSGGAVARSAGSAGSAAARSCGLAQKRGVDAGCDGGFEESVE